MPRRFFVTILLALFFAVPSQADDSAIRDVIAGQLDAFQRDDFEDAFEYASPMIQQIFGTPAAFGDMVQRGYPMVYRPQAVRFGDVVLRDGIPHQQVTFADQNGRVFSAEYEMIELGDVWKINGVWMIDDAGLGA